mgnify:CR=1 FL=1
MVVVWDAYTGAPAKTIMNPHPHGVAAVDITPDGSRICTLSHVQNGDSDEPQVLALWDWATERTAPVAAAELPTHDTHQHVAFNPANPDELVTTGPERVVFWGVEPPPPEAGLAPGGRPLLGGETPPEVIGELSFFAPPVSAKQLGGAVAPFTVSTFLPGTTQAVTGTLSGEVVQWDAPPSALAEGRFGDKAAMKKVRVTRDDSSSLPGFASTAERIPVLTLTLVGEYLAVGDHDGAVRFFDYGLRLVAWFDDVNAGPVTSISFAAPGGAVGMSWVGAAARGAADAITPHGAFSIPDFVVGTARSLIVGLQGSAFARLTVAERQGTVLVQGIAGDVVGVAAHPSPAVPRMVTATATGALQLWDTADRRLLMVRLLDTEQHVPSSIAWDPTGTSIAVGTEGGAVLLLHGEQLTDAQKPLHNASGAVQHLAYSHCGRFLATADSSRHVCLHRFLRTTVSSSSAGGKPDWALQEGEQKQEIVVEAWVLLGRAQAHSQAIVSLQFGVGDFFNPEQTPDALVDSAEAVAPRQVLGGYGSGAEVLPAPPLLASVGADRRVVQYDCLGSSVTGGFKIKHPRVKIEQGGCPSALAWYPRGVNALQPLDASPGTLPPAPPGADADGAESSAPARSAASGGDEALPTQSRIREQLFITASDEHRWKVWSNQGASIRRTVTAPTFGGAVTSMVALPDERIAGIPLPYTPQSKGAQEGIDADPAGVLTHAAAGAVAGVGGGSAIRSPFMAYCTAERVVGVTLLPLDGNPHRCAAVVAHPGKITAVAAVPRGGALLTAGGTDGMVGLWRVNTAALTAQAAAGGGRLAPFLNMLEGGMGGALYQEICDFFAYAQIRSEGEASTAPRRAGDSLPLSEVPNLVRALGYYPTEAEVQALVQEVQYAREGAGAAAAETAGGEGAEGGGDEDKEGVSTLVSSVSLGTVIRLFVNHRRSSGVSHAAIADALRTLKTTSGDPEVDAEVATALQEGLAATHDGEAEGDTMLPWRLVLSSLKGQAEALGGDEVRSVLASLLGEGTDAPVVLGASAFTHDVLGFEN